MKRTALLLCLVISTVLHARHPTPADVTRWESHAKNTRIIRDHFGIPHIYGKTDANAVFGLLYAQCEDDFKRVEMNYIEKLGRLSEIEGAKKLYDDLLIRMVIDSSDAIRDYRRAPLWLRKLCDAFADGINYFLYKNPDIKPALLQKFESWFPLLWTDGSIGAISTAGVGPHDLENLFAGKMISRFIVEKQGDPTGSNGFAFSPSVTSSGNAILYINPHVTFYFRPEVHMVSDEGLNTYGAVTWGQFFVYQGFNEHCGWMHTSGYADVSDAYIEKIVQRENGIYYLYDNTYRKITQKNIKIKYLDGSGTASRSFNTWFTGHGPVMAKTPTGFISVKSNNRNMNGLIQSWKRTKSTGFEDYKKIMGLRANTSNNTVFADSKGNIAYWHGNFIPKRDPRFDWSRPVDGTTSATEWKGLHRIEETVHIYNPSSGWIQNCNSTPFTAAGKSSPIRENYPSYMAPDQENFRGINAVRIFEGENGYTLGKVIFKGYDTYLPAFEHLVPALQRAFDKIPANDPLHAKLAGPLRIMAEWNFRCDTGSVANTLAILWGEKLIPSIQQVGTGSETGNDFPTQTKIFARTAPDKLLLDALSNTIRYLEKEFGSWRIAWGSINRFQRISGEIEEMFSDNRESFPIPFVSAAWGMLPSYYSRTYPGTKKRYGHSGNSFVCAVEFGKKVEARSLLAGGESGNPRSKHFNDQGLMYSRGEFKKVLFYKDDVLRHKEREYHPGEAGSGPLAGGNQH